MCVNDNTTSTYAYVEFDAATKKQIHKYCVLSNIPNAVRPDKLHTTLLSSRTPMPEYTPSGTYDFPLVAVPIGLATWETTNDAGEPSTCLVVLLSCPHLVARHKFLMAEYDGTFDHPSYLPHVTLSYDVHDLNTEALPFFENLVPHLIVVAERSEPLNPQVDIRNHKINVVDFVK